MDLKQRVKNLPSCPGIYMMKDSLGSIIYVGKSKNLRNRVQSYFYSSKGHSPKVEKLVNNLKDFEYITTDTEFEAFMLECKLIKELKPMYNKKMKSPLSYTYICINMNEKHPSIEISNFPVESDCCTCFGPYTNKNTVEKALLGIRECCKILCDNSSKSKTTCLNYSLGLCIGLCQGGPVLEQYNNILHRIIGLISGCDNSILLDMEQRMFSASERFDFETAAKYRDYIDAVSFILNRQEIIEFSEENKNIVMIEFLNENTLKLFLINRNIVLFSKKYEISTIHTSEILNTIKEEILTYFKTAKICSSNKITKDEIDEAQIIYSYLKYNNSRFTSIPQKWLDKVNSRNIINSITKLLFP